MTGTLVMEKSREYVELADAHCHLDLFGNPEAVVKDAVAKGVVVIVTAGGSAKGNESVLRLAGSPHVFGVIGIDPQFVSSENTKVDELEVLLKSNRNVVGIGEIGLDRKAKAGLDEQKRAFVEQISIAKNLDVPIVVHSRGMIDEVIKVIEEQKVERALFHFFEGNVEQAKMLSDRGFLISIPPAGLERRKRIINALDIDSIATETDCPVVGKEPGDVASVVDAIANIKGLSFGDAALSTTENVKKFFYV